MPTIEAVYAHLPSVMSAAVTINAPLRREDNATNPLRLRRIRVTVKDVRGADKKLVLNANILVSWEEIGRDVFYRLKIDNGDWLTPDTPETVGAVSETTQLGAYLSDRMALTGQKGNLNDKSTSKTLFVGGESGMARSDLTRAADHIITVQALSPTGAVIGEGRAVVKEVK